MSVNKISYESYQAFANLNFITFHVWELKTLERIDDSVYTIWHSNKLNKDKAKYRKQDDSPTTDDQESLEPNQISIKNIEGVRAIMLSLKAKHKDKHNKVPPPNV